MTTTTDPATVTTTDLASQDRTAPGPVWKAGLLGGLVAASGTVAVVAVAHAAGTPVETAPGTPIPLLGFAQVTLFFVAIGTLLARTMARRADHPRTTFVRTTVVLTALSLVPDALLSTDATDRLVLVLTHLVAAAIVIPALSSRLATDR